MVGVKRALAVGGLTAVLFGLAGCPSQLLTRIKEEIAKYPFTATSYTFVRQFGSPHPEYSFASPIVKTDTAGNIYVADSSFRIRKFNSAGALQKTFSGVSLLGPGALLYDMAFDTAGNIYTVTNNPNQIQKYDSAGNLLLEWGGTTIYNGVALSSPNAIAVDSAGGVYVSDHLNYRVVKFDTSGNYQSYFGSQGNGGGLFQYPDSIVVDKNNDVYVLDRTYAWIQKFHLGSYVIEWGGTGTPYGTLNVAILGPYGLTISPGSTQYIYVIDSGNNRGLKFTTGGAFVANSDWGSFGTADGQFKSARSIAVDSSGVIYVADNPVSGFGGRIQKFNGSVAPPTWIASWGGGAGSAPGVIAAPWGVAFDPTGNILVVDILNSRVEKFDSAGNFIATWGQAGSGPGDFAFPTGLATDATGNMYVSEMSNSRFTILDPSGAFLRTVGSAGTGDGYFSGPIGIAVDGSGNIYVADAGNERVQVFGPDFNFLRKFGSVGAGDGQFTASGDYGVAVDKSGNVYVSDWRANRVQKFDSQGNFLLKWGTLGTGNGQFNGPVGLATDAVGNVYVCDMANRRVQKFDSNGTFLTKFGVAGAGNGGFGWPVSAAVDSKGNVAVSDYTGALVQIFSPEP